MPKALPVLPADTKLDYAVVSGVPTINVAIAMTNRAQVTSVCEQLARLGTLLPEARTRKPGKRRKNGPVRDPRQTDIETVLEKN